MPNVYSRKQFVSQHCASAGIYYNNKYSITLEGKHGAIDLNGKKKKEKEVNMNQTAILLHSVLINLTLV